MGLSAVGFSSDEPVVKKAVSWLYSVQNSDGGFSESPESYLTDRFSPYSKSTASQTAWALMGLVAAGKANEDPARRAAKFLLETKNADGVWDEKFYTGTGFEGHFYIRYHGYRHFFPLLALARFFKADDKNRN
jgi:squalene-hopene/tetraprenyl-beta-curcumene cyclase